MEFVIRKLWELWKELALLPPPKTNQETKPDNYPKPIHKIIGTRWAAGLSAVLRGSCWPAWMSSVELLPKGSPVVVLPSIMWCKAMISGFCHCLQLLTLMLAELTYSKIVHIQWHGDRNTVCCCIEWSCPTEQWAWLQYTEVKWL